MRLIVPYDGGNNFIDTVVRERRAGRNAVYFNEIKEQWKERAQEYATACGNPEIVKPWPGVAAHAEKFENLYLKPGPDSVQKPILEKLRERVLQVCPACGEDGTPNTLDHYLPKTLYPEFSITALNLFPMCDICQGEKLTQTVNLANQRLFMHPYYDEFADAQVVHLQIGRPLRAPTSMQLIPHPDLNQAQTELVGRHITSLNMVIRYNRFFQHEYIRLLKLVNDARSHDQNVGNILNIFRNYARSKSINSWAHVFYNGVLADAELVAFLEHGNLPDFL